MILLTLSLLIVVEKLISTIGFFYHLFQETDLSRSFPEYAHNVTFSEAADSERTTVVIMKKSWLSDWSLQDRHSCCFQHHRKNENNDDLSF
jgi:hypothetical protein